MTHYKGLIFGGADTDKDDLLTVCQFEGQWWKHQYIVEVRMITTTLIGSSDSFVI